MLVSSVLMLSQKQIVWPAPSVAPTSTMRQTPPRHAAIQSSRVAAAARSGGKQRDRIAPQQHRRRRDPIGIEVAREDRHEPDHHAAGSHAADTAARPAGQEPCGMALEPNVRRAVHG